MATKPYTVVLYKNTSDTYGMYIGEDVPSGIYIVTTEVNSPAAKANIQPGDRVLAVNGQLVSSMYKNPRETISEIAKTADSLTLSIEPSNLLQNIDLLPNTNFSNTSYRYISKETNGIDHDLENYIKTLLGNQNLQIVPSTSSNRNEYILTYPHSSRSRRHRKRPPLQPIQTQPSIIDGPKDSSPLRSIPSMGTSHALLRNSQLLSKDGGINESPNIPSANNVPSSSFPPPPPPQIFNFPPQPSNNPVNTQENVPLIAAPFQKYFSPQPPQPPPPQSSNNPVNNRENLPPPPINKQGFREILLRRRQDFEGFGFHLQYNKVYYIINQVEPNSPAEQNGLRPNDIICKVNNQTTDQMSHKTFVQIVHASTEIILLVQSYDEYVRANPHILQNKNIGSITEPMVNNDKKDDDKRQNAFSKALTKLTSR